MIHLFGIRHHGPGSARSVVQALEEVRPDVVLVEGPAEAEAVLPQILSEEMVPPVALLLYRPDEPSRAAFYPFAEFSPEWQALHWAQTRGLPVRFMDLPLVHGLADGVPQRHRGGRDPLQLLAEADGYGDSERWWERLVETRRSGGDLFQGIQEAMTAVREALGPSSDRLEILREAAMRRGLRQAARSFGTVAVVCGAWHVPALAAMPSARSDQDLLKGLPKVRVQATWIPWTYERLAFASGYGAGVVSPGYYEHLWRQPAEVASSWLTAVARHLREEGLDASSAGVIEAVRLAETLAALRDRPLPGLEELQEAAQAVLCGGSSLPMALLERRLVVGERLGSVPADTTGVPLQEDLRALQRRLRMKVTPGETVLDLDLREPFGLERSLLLHRLEALDVPWGRRQEVDGKRGTFHEVWILRWEPELSLSLIEASRYGSTVASAATACLEERFSSLEALGELTSLLELALLADLPEAVSAGMARLRDRAALSSDVSLLMEALPPLLRSLRYSSVRGVDASALAQVVEGLAVRVYVGLPSACASLDDDAAERMYGLLVGVNASLGLVPSLDRGGWHEALARVARLEGGHGLVAGRGTRLLMDAGVWEEAATEMSLALSHSVSPARAAAWVEGFLRGSGLVLLHDEALWGALDRWVAGLGAEVFEEMLPLLRRTFSSFPAGERRQMGERMKVGSAVAGVVSALDVGRAGAVLPLVRRMLGL